MNDLESFRQEVASWLEDNCPPSMRTPMKETDTIWGGRKFVYPSEDAKLWKERMAAKAELEAEMAAMEAADFDDDEGEAAYA